MGIRDSKQLSPARRAVLYGEILKAADGYYISKISPRTIDRSVKRHRLNDLEARYMARVISRLQPDVSYVDSCDVNPSRFGRRVSQLAGDGCAKIHSSHKADARYTIVAAASIIAKVTRDREISKLQRKYGGRNPRSSRATKGTTPPVSIGSGYPSDSRTVVFVRSRVRPRSPVPPFIRASWKPVRIMLSGQQTLL